MQLFKQRFRSGWMVLGQGFRCSTGRGEAPPLCQSGLAKLGPGRALVRLEKMKALQVHLPFQKRHKLHKHQRLLRQTWNHSGLIHHTSDSITVWTRRPGASYRTILGGSRPGGMLSPQSTNTQTLHETGIIWYI